MPTLPSHNSSTLRVCIDSLCIVCLLQRWATFAVQSTNQIRGETVGYKNEMGDLEGEIWAVAKAPPPMEY